MPKTFSSFSVKFIPHLDPFLPPSLVSFVRIHCFPNSRSSRTVSRYRVIPFRPPCLCFFVYLYLTPPHPQHCFWLLPSVDDVVVGPQSNRQQFFSGFRLISHPVMAPVFSRGPAVSNCGSSVRGFLSCLHWVLSAYPSLLFTPYLFLYGPFSIPLDREGSPRGLAGAGLPFSWSRTSSVIPPSF